MHFSEINFGRTIHLGDNNFYKLGGKISLSEGESANLAVEMANSFMDEQFKSAIVTPTYFSDNNLPILNKDGDAVLNTIKNAIKRK